MAGAWESPRGSQSCNSVRENKAGSGGLLQSNAVRAWLGFPEVGEDLGTLRETLKIPGDMDGRSVWHAGVLAVLGIVGCRVW